jgi:hypothetical protein
MAMVKDRKRYRLGGEFVFRDVDGIEQRLPAGTELGPMAMAGLSAGEIAVHVGNGMFVPIEPDRQGLVGRLRFRTT